MTRAFNRHCDQLIAIVLAVDQQIACIVQVDLVVGVRASRGGKDLTNGKRSGTCVQWALGSWTNISSKSLQGVTLGYDALNLTSAINVGGYEKNRRESERDLLKERLGHADLAKDRVGFSVSQIYLVVNLTK